MSRLSICADIINSRWKGEYSLLDVGCRTKELKKKLRVSYYQGIDLVEGAEILSHDLEKPIPIEDNKYDIVVALDVVEHVENAHQLLSELLRISCNTVIVSLPNMYYWKFRLNVLLGKDISGKYIFSSRPCKDRHRWVTSFISSERFIRDNASSSKIEVIPIICERKRNKLFMAMDLLGVKIFPNFFAYGGLFILTKQDFRN